MDSKYDAFISYRHSELDKFVATTLHKKLEAFKLPKGVKSPTGKKKIERVFRDQDELPLASNLSDPITQALENSDYLLVICTPRLPESEWCKREIETFIKLHGRDKVLAVLAEGEPEESFPEALTKEAYEVTNPDGTTETRYRIFEPLAADVRGKNNKAIKKAMNDAILRICAAIFGLNYDELKQRHKERAMRRTLSVVSAVAAALMLFSAVCLGLMFKIINQSEMILDQNTEITQQYHEIQAQSEQIKEQNKQIEEQYTEAKLSLARATTITSQNLISNGRKFDAIYALRKVMPSSLNDDSFPYSADTEYALSNALELYADSGMYIGGRSFESESVIKAMKMSPDGSKIGTIDACNNLRIWDIESGNELFHKTLIGNFTFNENRSFIIADEENIIYNDNNQIVIYNLNDNTERTIPNPFGSDKHNGELYRFGYSNIFVLFAKEGFEVYDLTNLNCISYHSFEETGLANSFTYLIFNSVFVSDDGNELYFITNKTSLDPITISRLDISSDTFSSFKSELTSCYSAFEHEGNIYIAGSRDVLNEVDSEWVISIDASTEKVNWETKVPSLMYDLLLSYDSQKIYGIGYDIIYYLDVSTGNIDKTFYANEKICNAYVTVANSLKIYTKDCSMCIASEQLSDLLLAPIMNHPLDIYASTIYSIDNRLYIMFEGANYVSMYEKKESTSEPIADIPYSLTNDISENELFLRYFASDANLEIYSLDSDGPLTRVYKSHNNSSFVGDGSNYFADYGSGVNVYNISDGSILKELPSSQCPGFGSNAISYDKNYIMSNMSPDGQLYLYSLSTLDVEAISEPDIPYGENIDIINLDTDNYAVLREIGTLEFYKRNAKKPYFTTSRPISRNVDGFHVCYNAKIFSIAYSDGSMEFYSFGDTTELIKTCYVSIYNASDFDDFTYYRDANIYTLNDSSYTFVFNEDLEITAIIPSDVYYLPSKDCFVYCADNQFYSVPHYKYDDLIRISDEVLGDYIPSKSTMEQYGIVQ